MMMGVSVGATSCTEFITGGAAATGAGFLEGDFFLGAFLGAAFGAGFLTATFFAAFLAGAFLAGAFLAAFLAGAFFAAFLTAFFTAAFFTAAFFATGLLAAFFLAAAFFFWAISLLKPMWHDYMQVRRREQRKVSDSRKTP
jgi:hypothetical protein